MFDGSSALSLPIGARRWWVLAVVVSAQFIFVVDAFIVNVALPSVAADLRAGTGEMDAVIAVYQATYAALVITGARLGDMHGLRPVFIIGVLAFTAASAWCGLAASAPGLVLARLVQGATAALMVPQVLAFVQVLFPGEGRDRAFAVFGIALGTGGAAGFLLGGFLVTVDPLGMGWRSVFLVNLPFGVLIVAAACRLLPAVPRRAGVRLDGVGAVLLTIGLLGLVGPVLAGPRMGWPLLLWGMMAGAAVLLTVLLRWQRGMARRGGQPLLDVDLLRHRPFRNGLGIAAAFQFGNVAFYLVVTLFLQGHLGLTPLQGGLAIVPLALAFTAAAHGAGTWVRRHGKRVLLLGSAAQLCALLLLGVLTQVSAVPAIVTALTLFGFGQGMVMAPLAGLVLAEVAPKQAGAASGLLNTVQQASGAVGVTATGLAYAQDGIAGSLGLLGGSVLLTMLLLHWGGRRGLNRNVA